MRGFFLPFVLFSFFFFFLSVLTMIPSRTVLLLLALCSIVAMVMSAVFSDGEELEDDVSLANFNALEG